MEKHIYLGDALFLTVKKKKKKSVLQYWSYFSLGYIPGPWIIVE